MNLCKVWMVWGVVLFASFGAAYGQVQQFHVGDAVEIQMAGTWRPCTIAAPLIAGGYDVHCGPLDLRAKADADHIRAAAPTDAAAKALAETAAAMKNRPQGNGIGAQYGTREPAACANRGGPLNAGTAKQYFICDAEGEKAGIIKALRPVVSARQAEVAEAVIEREAARLGAPLGLMGRDFDAWTEGGRLVFQGPDRLLDLQIARRSPVNQARR